MSAGHRSLPLPLRLLMRLFPVEVRDAIAGDLLEEYVRLGRERGRLRAWVWCCRQPFGRDLLRLRRELRQRQPYARPPDRPSVNPRNPSTMSLQRPSPLVSLDSLGTEVRGAIRGLRRSPVFTTIAVLTLALGIGTTVAAFAVLDQVLLRPLPYRSPERLVSSYWERADGIDAGVPFAHAAEMAEAIDELSGVAWIVRPTLADEIVLRAESGAELVRGFWVSANLFDVLGVRPMIGPGFSAEANQPGHDPTVVLAHGGWIRRFGADPAVVGRMLEINGREHRVTGVLPASFELPGHARDPELWLPYPVSPEIAADHYMWALDVVARIADGVPAEAVEQRVSALGAELSGRQPDEWGGLQLLTRPLRERQLGAHRGGLALLLTAASAVLLVACSNLANLMLARTAERRRELALRVALGGGRVRVARPLLVESILLGLAGGAVGLAGSLVATRWLIGTTSVGLPRSIELGLDPRLAAFAIALSVASGLLFALLPGMRAARIGYAALGTAGSAGDAADHRFRAALVAVESAIVLTLLIAGALALTSLRNLLDVDPGFATADRVTMTLNLPQERYRDRANLHGFLAELETRLAALPGVRAAGTISHLPLLGDGWGGALYVEGRPLTAAGEQPIIDWELASPGYFEAAGISLLEGRGFELTDEPDATSVTIVNETLARASFPDGDAVGRRVSDTSAEGPWRTIVGVVADVKQQDLSARTRPYMYLPPTQVMAWPQQDLVVWLDEGGEAVVAAVRSALRELEPEVAISNVRPMSELVAASVATPRFRVLLLGLFGTMAVGLGAVGIYGVVACATGQRTRELGVRLALGARPSQLVRRVTLQGLRPVAVGVVVGLAGGVATGRLMAARLYGVDAIEPMAMAAAALALLLVAWAAAWAPARRAARVDPAQSLRAE